MTSQVELRSRAALCRQLAKREPANGVLWMAEAAIWSRLSKEKSCGETSMPMGVDVLGSRRAQPPARPIGGCGVAEVWERSSTIVRSLIYLKT